ncbi:hypothetical protein Y032_0101g3359 [Ancylostoma ceylanicum]|nr:hypothetical protein Y032_0101g3359 [Ancylostoma ceylanicum]
MTGITLLDRIYNQEVQQRFGVAPMTDELREARLRWYGHVLRADNDSVGRIVFNLGVTGKRPKVRPKQRWMDTLHYDPNQVYHRIKWRREISKADPATRRDKR